MALPLKYNLRNVVVRWRATLATVLGVALVVAVYVLVESLAAGLEKSSQNTGDPHNVMIVRKGSTAESSSQVTRDQYRLIRDFPQVARNADGTPMLSADVIVLISLPRRGSEGEANVLLRGLSPLGMDLRPQVKLAGGRWFTPGRREVVVSRKMAGRFANFDIGSKFKTGNKELTVVGQFDGNNSAFDSEVWMDTDEARQLFDRENYSSVLVHVNQDADAAALEKRMEADKRLPLRALKETEYYAAQTMTAKPIKFLGGFLATMMSIGAIFAAMNTMYASVGARTREIGTMRALGFRRRSIMAGFLIEGALLSFFGGVIGCGLSFFLHGKTTGTFGFETFSEIIFQFRITPPLVIQGLVFSIIVGILGSFFPALRAARLPVIVSLKSV